MKIHGAQATSDVNQRANEIASRLSALPVQMSEDAVLGRKSTRHELDGSVDIFVCKEEHAGLVSQILVSFGRFVRNITRLSPLCNLIIVMEQ
jgi:hypothetical protein